MTALEQRINFSPPEPVPGPGLVPGGHARTAWAWAAARGGLHDPGHPHEEPFRPKWTGCREMVLVPPWAFRHGRRAGASSSRVSVRAPLARRSAGGPRASGHCGQYVDRTSKDRGWPRTDGPGWDSGGPSASGPDRVGRSVDPWAGFRYAPPERHGQGRALLRRGRTLATPLECRATVEFLGGPGYIARLRSPLKGSQLIVGGRHVPALAQTMKEQGAHAGSRGWRTSRFWRVAERYVGRRGQGSKVLGDFLRRIYHRVRGSGGWVVATCAARGFPAAKEHGPLWPATPSGGGGPPGEPQGHADPGCPETQGAAGMAHLMTAVPNRNLWRTGGCGRLA